ncbi:MAG: 4-hydroxy-tetrahydrodipicolinate reductase [Actinomycetales bacterium]|nr:4-hydroxy-tetrahydrodipicolinate reductase [Actinomycetales bacterium]
MTPLRIGVVGAAGRMGSEVVRAVDAADDLQLVAVVDLGDRLTQLVTARAEVIVDFTTPTAVMDTLAMAIPAGLHCVVGTTGFDEGRYAEVRALLGPDPAVGVVIAANFSVGAVLMMRFAAAAAAYFPSVEIVETHHPSKVDAPSGTAAHTAEVIDEVRRRANLPFPPDATVGDAGARGVAVGAVRVHSQRLVGAVARQQVTFAGPGELLTIEHDSRDRACFMPGVLRAVRCVRDLPGLTVGLDSLLD